MGFESPVLSSDVYFTGGLMVLARSFFKQGEPSGVSRWVTT